MDKLAAQKLPKYLKWPTCCTAWPLNDICINSPSDNATTSCHFHYLILLDIAVQPKLEKSLIQYGNFGCFSNFLDFQPLELYHQHTDRAQTCSTGVSALERIVRENLTRETSWLLLKEQSIKWKHKIVGAHESSVSYAERHRHCQVRHTCSKAALLSLWEWSGSILNKERENWIGHLSAF